METQILPTVAGEEDEDTEYEAFDLEYTDEEEKILAKTFESLGMYVDDDEDEIEPLGEIPEKEDFDE